MRKVLGALAAGIALCACLAGCQPQSETKTTNPGAPTTGGVSMEHKAGGGTAAPQASNAPTLEMNPAYTDKTGSKAK